MKPRGSIADAHRSRAYEFVRTTWASGDAVSTHVYRHRKSGRLWARKAEHDEWEGRDAGDWYEVTKSSAPTNARRGGR